MAKITNTYPDWVNAYRKKGQTIRKTTNGYGLYRCTSVYVPGGKPKSVQEYLGMIYKDRGFVPKAKDNKEDKSKPHYLEYGLSTFIMNNFKREIRRAAYNGNDNLLKLSVIKYICTFNGHSLFNFISRAEKHSSDVVHFQVHHHAHNSTVEFEKFAGFSVGKSENSGHAITDLQHGADFFEFDRKVCGLELFQQHV